jgi:hypothetical protein
MAIDIQHHRTGLTVVALTGLVDPTITGSLQNWGRSAVLENAYCMPGLWWSRNVVHWAKVKNHIAPPSHFTKPEAPGRVARGGLRPRPKTTGRVNECDLILRSSPASPSLR